MDYLFAIWLGLVIYGETAPADICNDPNFDVPPEMCHAQFNRRPEWFEKMHL